MNNNPQLILSDAQKRLVADLVSAYGIDASEVMYFPDDPKPFLSYEATCIIANQLLDLRDIDIQPIESGFIESLSLKCTLTLANGWTRSSVGVANAKELIDGRPMTPQQLFQTASARAIRNTLRTAGIDLIKLHESQAADSTTEYSGPARDPRSALIAQVHILGKEAGFIGGDGNKGPWRRFLLNRYGVDSSVHLSVEQLGDLAAGLRVLAPRVSDAAA